jgi:hypothetical protein
VLWLLVFLNEALFVPRTLFGEKREMALTFILGPDGQPMDPTDPGSPFRLE